MDIKKLLEDLKSIAEKPAEMKKVEYKKTKIKPVEKETIAQNLLKQYEELGQDGLEYDDLALFIINDGELYRKYQNSKDFNALLKEGVRKYKKEVENKEFTPEELEYSLNVLKDYYPERLQESDNKEYFPLDELSQQVYDLLELIFDYDENNIAFIEHDTFKEFIDDLDEDSIDEIKLDLGNDYDKLLSGETPVLYFLTEEQNMYESKLNEISDKLANKIANIRKANAQDASRKLRAIDDEHTAELTKIDNNYTNRDIMLGKADKDIDYVNSKYEPLENEQRKIIKKAEKNADLMAKRNARKNESKINEISDKLASKVVSKRMDQYKKEGDELDKQAADVVNAQNSLNPNVREIEKEYGNNLDNFFGGIKQKAHKLYRTINKRAQRLGKENEYGQYFDSLRKNESKLNEISDELADNVNTQRQVNALKTAVKYVNDKTEENRLAAKDARNKAKKNNELTKKWKDSKNESMDIVAKFNEGNNVHEIVKTDKGYNIRYNVVEGKAKTTTAPVKSLPVALDALKKRYPKAEQVTESKINEISDELKQKVADKRRENLKAALAKHAKIQDKYNKARADFEKADPITDEEESLNKAEKDLNQSQKELDKARNKYTKNKLKF